MSASKVKNAMDDIAAIIATERQALTSAKTRISTAVSNLNAIPSTFSAVVSEIQSYAPSGAFETLAQDELAKLTAEFQALRSAANDAVSALTVITEF